jgi:hypothetical protein
MRHRDARGVVVGVLQWRLASDRGIEYVSCALWPAAPREPAARAVTVSTTFSRAGRGDAIPAF